MKIKSVLAIISVSMMMCGLCGCGKEATESVAEIEIEAGEAASEESTTETEPTEDDDTKEASAETSVELSSLTDDSFVYNGKKISILDDVETSLATLGEPSEKSSESGPMKYYDYGTFNDKEQEGISYMTFIENGKEKPAQIDITVEGAKTSKGLGVGSTKDEVISTYGEPDDTMIGGFALLYNFDGYELSFIVDDKGNVRNIDYRSTEYINSNL